MNKILVGIAAGGAALLIAYVLLMQREEEGQYTINLVEGSNLISLPLNDPAITDAASLVEKIGLSCTQVTRWDAAEQKYYSYIPGVPLYNFDILPGEGYEVTMLAPASLVLKGDGHESPFAISLFAGYNMIGIPVNDSSVTNASTLSTKIGEDCTKITKWDSATQQYVSYIPGVPLNDFDIIGGEGYFILTTAPATPILEGESW